MSSTVTVNKWCDNTKMHDLDQEPATQTRTVLNEQGKPVLLDLCEQCDSDVLAIYQLAQFGSPITAANIKPRSRLQVAEQHPCPRCDYVGPSKGALGKHTRSQHGLSYSEAMVEIANQTLGRISRANAATDMPNDMLGAATRHNVIATEPLPKRKMGRPFANAPKPWKCAVPRCDWPGSTTENGIYQHITKAHGLNRPDYRQRYGAPVEEN